VSVVRQRPSDTTGSDSDESTSKGFFGRKKKKSKKEEGQVGRIDKTMSTIFNLQVYKKA
jgi:hypothetical protein